MHERAGACEQQRPRCRRNSSRAWPSWRRGSWHGPRGPRAVPVVRQPKRARRGVGRHVRADGAVGQRRSGRPRRRTRTSRFRIRGTPTTLVTSSMVVGASGVLLRSRCSGGHQRVGLGQEDTARGESRDQDHLAPNGVRLRDPHRFAGLGERKAGAYLGGQVAVGEQAEDRAHVVVQAGAEPRRA